MSAFDELDVRTAAAVGRMFDDPVMWRPMLAKSGSQYLAQPGGRPDHMRPSRELPAIVTWAVSGLFPVEATTGGGQVGVATLMIDFESMLFEDEWQRFGTPRKGDWIEMPKEKLAANRMVEVTQVGDDGSARIYCWCVLVKQ